MKPLYTGSDWTLDDIERIWARIDQVGQEVFKLDYYEPNIEIITAEQMLDAMSTVAMPIFYEHWSMGKSLVRDTQSYEAGKSNLAYEVVINTDPCIAYIMENNSITMQALVLAHSVCGHGGFFKNNYLFNNWTEASSILDYLKFARNYIKGCEQKYGTAKVERLLDSCHALQLHGVDKYKRPPKLKQELKEKRDAERIKYQEEIFNDLWKTVPKKRETYRPRQTNFNRDLPEENLLYFVEKHSPILEQWEREIVRIVRKIAQYFYPQRQTKLMNEGWATFIHYQIMTYLADQGDITEGAYLEFLDNHSQVLFQPKGTDHYYSGINPYQLGFAIFMDIKRICEEPTEEDKKWFPDLIGKDWLETTKEIMETYKDESFILQFLSPKVIRDLKLYTIQNRTFSAFYKVITTHGDEDIKQIREELALNYLPDYNIPKIEIDDVDLRKDRYLHLTFTSFNHFRLDKKAAVDVLRHLESLWGYKVLLTTKTLKGAIVDD